MEFSRSLCEILNDICPSVNTGCSFMPVSLRHSDLFTYIFALTAYCLIKFDPAPVSIIMCIGLFNPSVDKIM